MRHVLRWGLSACCALILAIVITPGADAATPDDEIAFQANTGSLWYAGNTGAESTGLGMMAGTSPSIAVTGPASYEVVFQGSNGTLWSAGTGTPDNWGLGMAPGTSPAIIALPPRGSLSGGVEIAYQGTNGDLWLAGRAAEGDTGLAMKAGTSPAITNLQSGGYQVAFQASTGDLWTTGTDGTYNSEVPMAAGTSPTITTIDDEAVTTNENTYYVSFQYSGGTLYYINWVASNYIVSGDTGDTLMPGTSPSDYDYDFSDITLVAFQGANGDLYVEGAESEYSVNLGLPMAAGTSPSITVVQDVGTEVSYQGSNGDLWVTIQNPDDETDWTTTDQGLGMMAGTSPAITAYYPCSVCRE
jgi:hypothetical protein